MCRMGEGLFEQTIDVLGQNETDKMIKRDVCRESSKNIQNVETGRHPPMFPSGIYFQLLGIVFTK